MESKHEKPKKKECFVIHHREDYSCPRCKAFYECRHCIEAKSINETISDYDAWILGELERICNIKSLPNLPLSTTQFLEIKALIQEIKEG